MIKLTISDGANVSDVTGLCESVTWSGDYQQCVRTLEFALIQSSTDGNVPVVKCELGNLVTFSMDGRVLFLGYIFSREKSTNNSKISIKCYDRGIYVKQNKGTYKFTGQTAENIASRVCSDFGIPTGELAATGIGATRIFNGVSLYNIIQTAYTLASQKNGKKYIARFVGDKFCVLEKKVNDETLILEGGVNLMQADVSESIEGIVNQVAIYDSSGNLARTVKNDASIRLYGLIQNRVKQASGKDVSAEANELLKKSEPEQKIKVENLGNIANVTGGTVVVHEPYTGAYGMFFIDSDTHTWKNGQYYNSLVLNFQNMMDEQEAGSLPNKTGSKTESKGEPLVWKYDPGGSEHVG